ncbi:MAG: ArdC family protein [Acidimicrobiales bacterium]
MAKTTAEHRDAYSIVTEQVIAALEAGTVPWHKPWSAEIGLPRNLSSGKAYRGINPFLLGCAQAARGFESPYWLTYKQAEERGGHVRRGETSSLVVFWRRLDPLKVRKVRDETGELLEMATLGAAMVLRYYNVFNVEQCENVPYPRNDSVRHEWDAIDKCENVVTDYLRRGPLLVEGGARACYQPRTDQVFMPEHDRFENAAGYYSTAFHELTHSTGHARRLARRDLLELHSFGDPSYSREELVAEMGAAMLCAVVGIEQLTVPNSAAYIASWLDKLRGDRRLVVTAAAQAQKAADLIRGISYAQAEAA